eukprot:TRINITY_DN5411_c0_g2_i4.p1 TRINITY_DN5411_c0_g2~~TRINITY_DN5411_c0_g2_i4.p1  ORF type:complete len:804 (+),score=139.24 TRINITY_DN5411_c0_g2_i4:686-3097(+)
MYGSQRSPDIWLRALAGSRLTSIHLQSHAVSDTVLPVLARLPHLQRLELFSTKISNPWMVIRCLAPLKELESLSFQPAVSDIPAQSVNPNIFEVLRQDSQRRRNARRNLRRVSSSSSGAVAATTTTTTAPGGGTSGPSYTTTTPTTAAAIGTVGNYPSHNTTHSHSNTTTNTSTGTGDDMDADNDSSVDSGDFQSSSSSYESEDSDYFDPDVDLMPHGGFLPLAQDPDDARELLDDDAPGQYAINLDAGSEGVHAFGPRVYHDMGHIPDPYRHTHGANQFKSAIVHSPWYRVFLLYHLPQLKMLDGLVITEQERESARVDYENKFAIVPRAAPSPLDNVCRFTWQQRVGAGGAVSWQTKGLTRPGMNHMMEDVVTSARLTLANDHTEYAVLDPPHEYSPRQFEYHPTDPSLLVVGTETGHSLLVDRYHCSLIGSAEDPGISSLGGSVGGTYYGQRRSILGLSWLKKNPSRFLAGRENGSMTLWDIGSTIAYYNNDHDDDDGNDDDDDRLGHDVGDATTSVDLETVRYRRRRRQAMEEGNPTRVRHWSAAACLTSLAVSCDDERAASSGYSNQVQIWDLETGHEFLSLTDIHGELTNNIKFANHSPNLFVTTSMDRSTKLWDIRAGSMNSALQPIYTYRSPSANSVVSFSPDDRHLLLASCDNVVTQIDMHDGSNPLRMDLPQRSSPHNYTRAYYANQGQYIISGSCEESYVHITSAQTGKLLKRVDIVGSRPQANSNERNSLYYIQSLRADPHHDFSFAVLACSLGASHSVKGQLVAVDLIANRRLVHQSCYNNNLVAQLYQD